MFKKPIVDLGPVAIHLEAVMHDVTTLINAFVHSNHSLDAFHTLWCRMGFSRIHSLVVGKDQRPCIRQPSVFQDHLVTAFSGAVLTRLTTNCSIITIQTVVFFLYAMFFSQPLTNGCRMPIRITGDKLNLLLMALDVLQEASEAYQCLMSLFRKDAFMIVAMYEVNSHRSLRQSARTSINEDMKGNSHSNTTKPQSLSIDTDEPVSLEHLQAVASEFLVNKPRAMDLSELCEMQHIKLEYNRIKRSIDTQMALQTHNANTISSDHTALLMSKIQQESSLLQSVESFMPTIEVPNLGFDGTEERIRSVIDPFLESKCLALNPIIPAAVQAEQQQPSPISFKPPSDAQKGTEVFNINSFGTRFDANGSSVYHELNPFHQSATSIFNNDQHLVLSIPMESWDIDASFQNSFNLEADADDLALFMDFQQDMTTSNTDGGGIAGSMNEALFGVDSDNSNSFECNDE